MSGLVLYHPPDTPAFGGQGHREGGAGRPALQVLVIDDLLTMHTLLEQLLRLHGFVVRQGIDGQQALDDVVAFGPQGLFRGHGRSR